ncbi:MAG: hypothetical protein E5W88_19350 [Mesorhizobium sp.]|nr:MAG: hypothetical protein E5W88_19350 [Mesorhizobium sp.]TIT51210.1 MAG: hypothetical protein E5W75_08570 [Mesorhizobium sp.]
MRPACKWRRLRFRCSRTLSTLRSGSRTPPFSTRPDLILRLRHPRAEQERSDVAETLGSIP